MFLYNNLMLFEEKNGFFPIKTLEHIFFIFSQ